MICRHFSERNLVSCIWCGEPNWLCETHTALFTGCTKDCRANVVRLLNKLWKVKLGSKAETRILARLRNPPLPKKKRKEARRVLMRRMP
jgi:steroid 5-alpha reductase family enzyme